MPFFPIVMALFAPAMVWESTNCPPFFKTTLYSFSPVLPTAFAMLVPATLAAGITASIRAKTEGSVISTKCPCVSSNVVGRDSNTTSKPLSASFIANDWVEASPISLFCFLFLKKSNMPIICFFFFLLVCFWEYRESCVAQDSCLYQITPPSPWIQRFPPIPSLSFGPSRRWSEGTSWRVSSPRRPRWRIGSTSCTSSWSACWTPRPRCWCRFSA